MCKGKYLEYKELQAAVVRGDHLALENHIEKHITSRDPMASLTSRYQVHIYTCTCTYTYCTKCACMFPCEIHIACLHVDMCRYVLYTPQALSCGVGS